METNDNCRENSSTASKRSGILQMIRSNIVAIVIILVLVTGYFLLRTSPSDVASMEELQALMKNGQPVLVELYSNT